MKMEIKERLDFDVVIEMSQDEITTLRSVLTKTKGSEKMVLGERILIEELVEEISGILHD